MKFFKRSICLSITILFLFPSLGFSQTSESSDSLKIELTSVAREIMTSVKTCALITMDSEGVPRARAMDPFSPENDFTIWFGTKSDSRKVDQIRNNPKVTLYYLESDESGYVTIHGKASIVNDELEKEKRWKEEWGAFYENKANDYILIKVSPIWMEVVSYAHGIVSNSTSWAPPVVIFEK